MFERFFSWSNNKGVQGIVILDKDTGEPYDISGGGGGGGGTVDIDQTTPGTTDSVTVKASAGIGSLTETAPATDTASSGLNGRLQRIAQRLTSLIASIPSQGIAVASSSLPVVVAAATTYADASSTITTGGTAQTALASNTSRRRFEIQNIDTTNELLCFSFTGTASLTDPGSFQLSPASASVPGGYYSGEATGAISIIASTTGHKFTLKWC